MCSFVQQGTRTWRSGAGGVAAWLPPLPPGAGWPALSRSRTARLGEVHRAVGQLLFGTRQQAQFWSLHPSRRSLGFPSGPVPMTGWPLHRFPRLMLQLICYLLLRSCAQAVSGAPPRLPQGAWFRPRASSRPRICRPRCLCQPQAPLRGGAYGVSLSWSSRPYGMSLFWSRTHCRTGPM